jgi:thiamine kinase-like enzyme
MNEQRPMIQEISTIRRDWSAARTKDYVSVLPIWNGAVEVEQLFGGLQNRTYVVRTAAGEKFAGRVGFDQYRTRQTSVVQCTIAAHALGLGPRLVYAEPNLTVTEWIDGRRMEQEELKDWAIMRRVIDRMKILHEGTNAVRETISYWWPFDTVRRYLVSMETGKKASGFQPSKWVHLVPMYRDITNRLEKAIGPYYPKLTHNDMAFVNMIFDCRGEIMFIDWDGGGYGHPLWDLGEMLMWAEANDETVRFAIEHYYGSLPRAELSRRVREVHAFQVVSALRLIVEVMETDLDPYFFLTPEEMAEGMKIILPGQKPELNGLVDLLMPRFHQYWKAYEHEFPSSNEPSPGPEVQAGVSLGTRAVQSAQKEGSITAC